MNSTSSPFLFSDENVKFEISFWFFVSNPKARWSKFNGSAESVKTAFTRFGTAFSFSQFYYFYEMYDSEWLINFCKWLINFSNSLQVINKMFASFLIPELTKDCWLKNNMHSLLLHTYENCWNFVHIYFNFNCIKSIVIIKVLRSLMRKYLLSHYFSFIFDRCVFVFLYLKL